MLWNMQLFNLSRGEKGKAEEWEWGANSVGRKLGECNVPETKERVFQGGGSNQQCQQILLNKLRNENWLLS